MSKQGTFSVYADQANIVVHTNNIQLTAAQRGRKNQRIGERGLGMGPIFVHKLTSSDINQNRMRIPKEIFKALNIPKKGWAILAMGEYDNFQDAAYYTSTSGRMRFKSGWKEFVDEFDLVVGVVALVLFHMESSGFMKIFIDVL